MAKGARLPKAFSAACKKAFRSPGWVGDDDLSDGKSRGLELLEYRRLASLDRRRDCCQRISRAFGSKLGDLVKGLNQPCVARRGLGNL